MKSVYCISTKQHGGMKSGISQSKNSTISQTVCAGALSCWEVQKSSCHHKHVKLIIYGVFCGCNGKTSTVCQQWTR